MPLINRNNTYNVITNNEVPITIDYSEYSNYLRNNTYNVITNNSDNIITNNSDNIITNNEVSITIDYSEYSNYLRNNNYITNNDIVDINTIVNINEDNVRNTASYDYVRELKTSVSKIFFSGNKLDREKFSMEIE